MADSSAKSVGRRIRVIRAAFGVSQGDVAKICGVTNSAVGNWEQGRSRPEIDVITALVERFDLTLDYVFLGRTHSLKHEVALIISAAEARS